MSSVPRRKSPEPPRPAEDGLTIREVGPWSRDKHHFLRRYVDAFTTAMGRNPKWTGLHYIDLFAGAGVERLKGGGLDWGSPLIAAMTPRPFTQLHVCEIDGVSLRDLGTRLNKVPQPNPPRLYEGDANVIVRELISLVPRTTLNLAFVDPYRLANLQFSTLGALSERRTDIIVFFPDFTDAVRNMLDTYRGDPNSPLSEYLGTRDWEAAIQTVSQQNWAATLADVFKGQLKTLGYCAFEEERIYREDKRRLYKLVFCSKDELGGKIWRSIATKKADGQRDLFL